MAPTDRKRSAPVKRAVLAARKEAITDAAVAARRNVRTAARAADLQLGALVSVAEPSLEVLFGLGYRDTALGTFGPGKFCGFASKPVIRRNPETGAPRLVRRKRVHRCSVPGTYRFQLRIRYEAG